MRIIGRNRDVFSANVRYDENKVSHKTFLEFDEYYMHTFQYVLTCVFNTNPFPSGIKNQKLTILTT